jgi:tetratricopeptide (TPR) repeat protein
VIRSLFLPLSVAGIAEGTQTDTDLALIARWLPDLVSRLVSGPELATAYARVTGQSKEGAPVLVAFTKPMPDDQARAFGRQHAANRVIMGTVEEGDKITVRAQILDVESETSRLVEDIVVARENLEQLPGQLADALLQALELAPRAVTPADFDFPSSTALRAFFQIRDVIARLEIGARPPVDKLESTMEPFFDLEAAMPGSQQALGGLVATLGRFIDPRTPQLVEPAKPLVKRALEIFPESAQLWHMQATVHASFSQPPQTDDAEEALRKAIEFDLNYLPARFALGDLYRYLGREEEEESLYTELADHEQLGAAVRERFGTVLANRGEMEQAEQQWRDALRLDPAFTPALRNLARYYQEQGNEQEAQTFFQKAVARPEKMPSVLYEYASTLLEREEFAQAIPYLQRHLRYVPNHVPSVVALGQAHRGLDDREAAISAFKRAAEMDPRGTAGADARLALFGLDKPDEASQMDALTERVWEEDDAENLAAIRSFLEAHEGLALWQPWYALGIGHRNLGQWQEAQDTLNQAFQLCPGQADVQTALGTCHLHFAMAPTGQLDPNRLNQAMALIGPALRTRPNDPTILAAFGLVYHMAGQFGEAERAYRRALDLVPDDPTAAQYLAALEEWKAGNRSPVI